MTRPSDTTTRKGRLGVSRAADAVVRRAIVLCGWTAIVVLGAIFVFLLVNAMKAIREIGLGNISNQLRLTELENQQ